MMSFIDGELGQFNFKDSCIYFRQNSPDMRVIRATLEKGEFDHLKEYVPSLKSGLIVDAGGYIGTSAIALSMLFPDARVVSIEPSLENYNLLCLNTRLFPNIVPVNAALSGAHGVLNLVDRRTGPWGFTTRPDSLSAGNENFLQKTYSLTVADVMRLFGRDGIDVMKVDIEGGEVSLFSGDVSWLENVGVVVVELHDRIDPRCTSIVGEAMTVMRRLEAKGEKVTFRSDAYFHL